MIDNYALSVCQPSPGAALKEVARQIGDRDNAVRKAALSALVQAYYKTGDKLYKLIGNVSEGNRECPGWLCSQFMSLTDLLLKLYVYRCFEFKARQIQSGKL